MNRGMEMTEILGTTLLNAIKIRLGENDHQIEWFSQMIHQLIQEAKREKQAMKTVEIQEIFLSEKRKSVGASK